MNQADKEFYLARILSGCVRCKVFPSKVYLLKKPSLYQKYIAEEIYQESLIDYQLKNLYTEESLYELMLERNLWSKKEEEKLLGLDKDIEQFKLKLFQLMFKSKEKVLIRRALGIAKVEKTRLLEKKYAYNHLSCSGAASLVKMRYLIGVSLYHTSGNPVFESDDSFWQSKDGIIDSVVSYCNKNKLDETIFREIARTEPWRSTWATKKACSVFDVPTIELSEEQKILVYWTVLFDNIFESQDCPSDDVIEDDDALDGWLIQQNNERKKRVKEKSVEDLIPDSMKKHSEIFLPADTAEDAKKIMELNDPVTRSTIRGRNAAIEKKGELNEDQLPDVKRNLHMQQVKKMHEQVKKV